MYVTRVNSYSKSGKKYVSELLRQSYREGNKVRTRTLLNLAGWSAQQTKALKSILKHKDLEKLESMKHIQLQEGLSFGAVWVVYQVAQRLGIDQVLGKAFSGRLALWQVIARVIDQGSRLSAVRLAENHAVDLIGIKRGFDENDLYDNLKWLADQQEQIEDKLYKRRWSNPPELFLYDVTSSYLEGQQNEVAEYGYNRDRKSGKKQIVIGLLCDEKGDPVSVQIFQGNTQDPQTVSDQIKKSVERFGCERMTFVGDRGMIKSGQIKNLKEFGFNYITAITNAQIKSLVKKGILQRSLFDQDLYEVNDRGVRYVIRRNPIRAQEIARTREEKQSRVQKLVEKKIQYLLEHPRAKTVVAKHEVQRKINQLKIKAWLKVKYRGRELSLEVDQEKLDEASLYDGCYALKSDLPETVKKEVIHARYKDLAKVEQAFRTCKTTHLEVRPIYVRKEVSTRGHVLVVMLSYLIVHELQKAWESLDLTVIDGLNQLKTLTSMEVSVGDQKCVKIPKPRPESVKLLEALELDLPKVLPHRKINVSTKKKISKG